MNITQVLLTMLVYGSVGQLAEVWFTAGWSFWHGDRKGTATTYAWMMPIYGLGGQLFGLIHDHIRLHPMVMALLYTVLIYTMEFGWHWLLERILKVRVWEYGRGSWTFMGRIQPRYFPAWYLLACLFNPIHDLLMKIFGLVARYG
jgi:uncharacterized membrane protein